MPKALLRCTHVARPQRMHRQHPGEGVNGPRVPLGILETLEPLLSPMSTSEMAIQ